MNRKELHLPATFQGHDTHKQTDHAIIQYSGPMGLLCPARNPIAMGLSPALPTNDHQITSVKGQCCYELLY